MTSGGGPPAIALGNHDFRLFNRHALTPPVQELTTSIPMRLRDKTKRKTLPSVFVSSCRHDSKWVYNQTSGGVTVNTTVFRFDNKVCVPLVHPLFLD
jgi:hypothetical protein